MVFYFNSFPVPFIIDTKIQAIHSEWNHDGSIVAVCGGSQSDKDSNEVTFYSAFGVVRIVIFKSQDLLRLYWESFGVVEFFNMFT